MEVSMKRIKVVCAIVQVDSHYLAVQRSDHMKLPNKWEFPGGKLEANETEEECIIREIKEELNLEIQLICKLTATNYDYSDISIELIPYLAEIKSGTIILKEHKAYQLLAKSELSKFDWAEADLPIVKEIENL